MTMAERLRIHREIEDGNRRRVAEHIRRTREARGIVAAGLTHERRAFREYMRNRTA
jgi:hypothetical protein